MRSRRTFRCVLSAAALASLTPSLAACGGSGGAKPGLDSVSVSGAVGSKATVVFDSQVTDPTPATKVLVKGTGPVVEQGDSVILQTVIADGFTQQTVADSYADHSPQVVTIDGNANKVYDGILGQPIGSRIALSEPADKVFGPSGNPQLGIGNKDVVLILFDVVGAPVDHPDGKRSKAPKWAPRIARKAGQPTALDFSGTPKPDGRLRSAALARGTGPAVQKGQTVFARYLGQVYGGKKPFDQNFTAAEPTPFQIGVGKVVKGWDKTLVGRRIGSEVVLAIPPQDGYGKEGQPSAHISGTDTLYFVVDIVGAA